MATERSTHPIRSLLKRSPLYASFKQFGHYPDYWYWKLRGEPRRIPHIVKQRTVLEYAQAFDLKTLIETGTYYGEMVAAVVDRFRKIYSIELDPELAKRAQQRFRRYSRVEIIQGDSQIVVPSLLQRLNERCLFWLDAGYCGWGGGTGNPNRLGSEFSAILSDKITDHVILMDDADGINGEGGSPTLPELIALVEYRYPSRCVEVARNIIRITPR
ncbi:MAG: rRNA adenine N-6-methyltransferase family protein [Candidatus Korobacteraceae bacterium]